MIAALGNSGAFAAKAATTTVPIVFGAGEDPVRPGLVASLAQPGGNLTGISILSVELVTKRLELLREMVPEAGGSPCSSAAPVTETIPSEVRETAGWRAMGLRAQMLNAEAAVRSMRLSQRLRASGPTLFSSTPTPSSSPGASNWSTSHRASRSRRFIWIARLPKSAG